MNGGLGAPGGGRIDDIAMGVFLAAVKRGAALKDAARAAGFTLGGFWRLRGRDRAFDLAVEEALDYSNVERFIAPGNGRRLQLKRVRRLRFVDWRKEVFLAEFARSCDETAAAEAAGVSTATVSRHCRIDPDFAEGRQRALEQGYDRLEAEALRQRLAAQQRLRAAEQAGEPLGPEAALEFERVLKLLQRWDRRGGRVGPRRVAPGRLRRWTFDEAIAALAAKLQALDASPRLPPKGTGRR
jgi:hypothetical protein